ncbi:TIR domain-containing protein [Candidatus Poribacteria bacterium]|nr:TIR domain-containing protein [Candidatus Poribacteria bacterium]
MRKYDVALSFAGEDRRYADELANLLGSGGYKVFYDKYEQAKLWGKDLYAHLSSVYKDQAHYCVMFLSEHYARKLWTNHERQNAQARAFQENREYILPVRIDDTEIPGILPTVGYLDLRSMTIKDIYQALVEKLSGLTSQTTTTDLATSAGVESDPGEFVRLRPEDGRLYFVPVQDARWDSTEISLELLPESSEEAAFLRSLRNNRRGILGFALQEDAAWVSPQEVVQTMSGSQTVWKVVLKEDSRGKNFSLFNDIAFNNISPDQIAEMRARRILLDEKLEAANPLLNQVNLLNQATLEFYIRGGVSSQHETRLQVLESPIPRLYRSFGQTEERFQKFARLASVLYLKLSNTVEEILQLDLELLNQRQLQVRFKGRRRRRFVNVEPSILEINGICLLSE